MTATGIGPHAAPGPLVSRPALHQGPPGVIKEKKRKCEVQGSRLVVDQRLAPTSDRLTEGIHQYYFVGPHRTY